jgi:hypothetical protein
MDGIVLCHGIEATAIQMIEDVVVDAGKGLGRPGRLALPPRCVARSVSGSTVHHAPAS